MAKTIKELKTKSEILIKNSDVVFICPHLDMDVDAIASSLGFYMIVKKLGKKPFIVLDDNVIKFEAGVKRILNELPSNISFIEKSKALSMVTKGTKALLAVVDTNKTNLVPFDEFDIFQNILIIDHHCTDDKTIDADYSYVDLNTSSASEIMFKLMNSYGVKLTPGKEGEQILIPNIANYLLGGIVVDTDSFKRNSDGKTTDTATKLQRKGASLEYADQFLSDAYNEDMVSRLLVTKAAFKTFTLGICYNFQQPDFIYNKKQLAKTANLLVDYRDVDAAFVLGYIRDALVFISARSKGEIDVSSIMHEMGGGGDPTRAAASVPSDNILEVKEKLEQVIRPGYISSDSPRVLK